MGNIPAKFALISSLSRPTSPIKPQFTPLTAAEASRQLIASLEADLHPTTFRIYAALHRVALEVAQARGYHPQVSHVTYHCPLEIVAAALGLHRVTLWRRLPELQQRRLIDARPHKTLLRNQVVNDGTLWQIKLYPERGKSARLTHEELRHKWRDLPADVARKRTAYYHLGLMQQSKTASEDEVNYSLLLTWALPPQNNLTPLPLTVAAPTRADLETVLNLPHSGKRERSAMVDTAAQAVCLALGDQSIDFYRLLFWNLLRHHDQGRDYFHQIYTMLQRARTDHREGFARKAGALFIARLKRAALWDTLAETPPHRVGVMPLAA